MKHYLILLLCPHIYSQMLNENCSYLDDSKNWETTFKLINDDGQESNTDEPKLLRKYPFIRDIPKFLRSKSCWSKMNSTKLAEFKEKQSQIMEDDVINNYLTNDERKLYNNYYTHKPKMIKRGLPILKCVRYERSTNLTKEQDTVYSAKSPLIFPICFLTFKINTKHLNVSIIDGAGTSVPLQRVEECQKADSCVIMMTNSTTSKDEDVEMTCCCTTHSCNSRPIILDPIVHSRGKSSYLDSLNETEHGYLQDTSETELFHMNSFVSFFQLLKPEIFIIIILITVIIYQNAIMIKRKCQKVPEVEEYSIVPFNR